MNADKLCGSADTVTASGTGSTLTAENATPVSEMSTPLNSLLSLTAKCDKDGHFWYDMSGSCDVFINYTIDETTADGAVLRVTYGATVCRYDDLQSRKWRMLRTVTTREMTGSTGNKVKMVVPVPRQVEPLTGAQQSSIKNVEEYLKALKRAQKITNHERRARMRRERRGNVVYFCPAVVPASVPRLLRRVMGLHGCMNEYRSASMRSFDPAPLKGFVVQRIEIVATAPQGENFLLHRQPIVYSVDKNECWRLIAVDPTATTLDAAEPVVTLCLLRSASRNMKAINLLSQILPLLKGQNTCVNKDDAGGHASPVKPPAIKTAKRSGRSVFVGKGVLIREWEQDIDDDDGKTDIQ